MNADTSQLIVKALDGLTARAEATAANIANASSPGYRLVRVAFEDALRRAVAQGPAAVAAVRPETQLAATPAYGTEMRVDLELATASDTALRYSALLDMLGRQGAILRSAIAGGR